MRLTAGFSRLLRLDGVWVRRVRFEGGRIIVEVARCAASTWSARCADTAPAGALTRDRSTRPGATWSLASGALRSMRGCDGRVVCLASVDVIAQGRKESSGCPPGRDRSRSELRLLAHRYDAKQKQTPTPDGEPRHVARPARRPPHHTWGHLSAADQAVAYLELRPSPHPRGGAMISRGLSRWLRRRASP